MEISKLSYAILYDFLTFWQIFFQVLQFLVINILSDLGGYSTDSICNFVFRLSSISRSFTQKYHGSKIVASKNDLESFVRSIHLFCFVSFIWILSCPHNLYTKSYHFSFKFETFSYYVNNLFFIPSRSHFVVTCYTCKSNIYGFCIYC